MPKIAVVLLALSCPAWASTLVLDFSFEDPVLTGGAGDYMYRPTGTAWDFGSGSDGITYAGVTNFQMASAESGNQAAFIQKANSQISQTITGLAVGQAYKVGFFAATRPDMVPSDPFYGGGEDFNVLWNGNVIGYYLPTSTSFSFYTTDDFIATSTTGVLSFVGIDSNDVCNQNPDGKCDRTAFIDDVGIYVPEPRETVLLFSGILLIGLALKRDLVKTRAL